MVLSLTFVDLFGQVSSELPSDRLFSHQFELRHDNDFIVLTDRYYSFGLFLSYKYQLENGIFHSGNELLEFIAGVEAFTPDNTKTTKISEMDRPYAGFLGLRSNWSITKGHNFLKFGLLLGVAGKASGAGALQRWYHNAIVVSDPQTWVGEISNSFHTNLYTTYAYEWNLAPNPFSVHLAVQSEMGLGSRDTYVQPQLIAYFGRRDSLEQSIAYDRFASNSREIFFSFSMGYRFVAHEGLLEGNSFGDNSIFVTTAETTQLRIGFDFQHRKEQNQYRVGYRYNSSAALNMKSHQYIILAYAFAF